MTELVFDARMINHSGIGTYCKTLLPEITREFNCTVLGEKNDLDAFIAPGTEVIEFSTKIYSINEQWNYRNLIPECKVFWSPHFNIPLAKIRAKNRITTIHDVYHLEFSKDLSPAQRLYARIVIKAAVKKSSVVITVSDFSKKELTRHLNISGEKIKVIHNGISPKFVKMSENDRPDAEVDGAYILYVGNVKPHKNLISLVRAFKIIRQRNIELKLVIVGKKEGFITGDQNIEAMCAIDPDIVFTGFVSDEELMSLYEAASMLVVPSLYEGFGYPLIEGMYFDLAILCSNIDVFKEVAADAALYFDPLDPDDIANRIQEVYESEEKRNSLIENGRRRIKSFTHQSFVEKHINTIRTMV